MAISKRTRFEVLRRDAYACRYCGARAPDVALHVDHVTPVALGGTDLHDNLVAACVDCNAGKGSTSPDAETVADAAEDALRWAQAMVLAGERANTLSEAQEAYVDVFIDAWDSFRLFNKAVPTPPNWRSIIVGYFNSHLPADALIESVNIAMSVRTVQYGERFPYFCGVVRNKLKDQTELAALLIERGEV